MEILRFLVALLIVFGLLGALRVLSKRGGKLPALPGFAKFSFGSTLARAVKPSATGGEHLRVVKKLHLTATHQVHLIRTGDEELLLCTYPQGCTVLQSAGERPAATKSSLAEAQRYAS